MGFIETNLIGEEVLAQLPYAMAGLCEACACSLCRGLALRARRLHSLVPALHQSPGHIKADISCEKSKTTQLQHKCLVPIRTTTINNTPLQEMQECARAL